MAQPAFTVLDRPLHTAPIMPPEESLASSETFSNAPAISPSSLFTSNFFLDLVAKENDETKKASSELVLRLYKPPNLSSREKNSKYRILVIGGGVTGLTARRSMLVKMIT